MEIALARVPGLESEPVENKKAKGPGREKNWAAAGKGLEAGVGPDHMPVGTEVVVVVVVAAVVVVGRARQQGSAEQLGGKAQEGVAVVVVEVVAEREERRWQRA